MPELQVFDSRFNLPVEEFVLQILRERFPDLDIRRGSVLYQAVVKPLAIMFQPFRDRLSVLRRNQSLRFYQYMRNSELDKLVANFFIERQPSGTASGTARIYFSQADNRTIPSNAVVSTADGLQYRAVTALAITAAEMSLNQEEGLFYVDLPVSAVAAGSDYNIEAESLFTVTGVADAVRVTNKAPFSAGRNIESNVELVRRTKDSLATRTLTSRNAIFTVLNEAFPGLILSQEVIGYGDPEMIRDIVKAYASFDDLFGTGFCRKFNVSYNPSTRAIWTGAGAPPLTYVLRGALIDVSNSYISALNGGNPYFWHEMEIERDNETFLVGVQRGDTVKINTSDISDPDAGDYLIRDIVFSEPFSTVTPPVPPDRNDETHILILDRPLVNAQGPNGFDPSVGAQDRTTYKYTISSGIRTENFHIGGKADLYVHTTGIFEDEIIIASLYPSGVAPSFFDIPVSSTPLTNPITLQPLYENGKAFLLPIVNIQKIEQLDPSNADIVLKTLVQGTDFVVIVNNLSTRFTPEEDIFIRFLDTDPGGANYNSARMRVVYDTNPDVQTLQEFVDQSVIHDTTKDILVKAAQAIQLDVQVNYRGTALVESAKSVVRSYIGGIPQGGTASVNDLVAVLNLFGINDIEFPVVLSKNTFNPDGTVTQEESEDRLSVADLQRFVPVDDLSVSKI